MSPLDDIYRTIPHRPPFLFIDEVVEVTERGAKARRHIRADEAHFAGHYPGNPIMPGVLLCEAVFQTAAVFLSRQFVSEQEKETVTPVLSRIVDARFKRMVKPGDTLDIEVELQDVKAGFHFMRGKITRGGQTVLTLECALVMLREQEAASA